MILLEKDLPFTLVHAVDNTLSTAINRLSSGLDALEQGAAEGRWLNSFMLSLADVAVACMLCFINVQRVMPNWCAAHPALVAMADRLFSRESFARILPPATAGLYSDETIAARV